MNELVSKSQPAIQQGIHDVLRKIDEDTRLLISIRHRDAAHYTLKSVLNDSILVLQDGNINPILIRIGAIDMLEFIHVS